MNAIERMPNGAIFHCNLACHICQPGDLSNAKELLHRAIKDEPQYRVMAPADEDLKPPRNSIATT